MSKVEITIDKKEIESTHEWYIGYLILGALDYARGRPLEPNPYSGLVFGQFWRRGWELGASGAIKVKQ